MAAAPGVQRLKSDDVVALTLREEEELVVSVILCWQTQRQSQDEEGA